MSIYTNWLRMAYNDKTGEHLKEFWDSKYLPVEQKVYEHLIETKTSSLSGTIRSLGEQFDMSDEFVCGFVDGLSEVNKNEIDMEKLASDTEIKIDFEFDELYKKMIEYRAEHLFRLPQWSNIFREEELKKFYHEQKQSGTFVNTEKVGRNDPCTCGSGKKYKKCCGM